MENAIDFIIVLNDRFKIENFNELAISKVLGYTQEDVIGKNMLKFLHPNDYEKAIQSIKINLANQHRKEFQIKKKDGTYIWGEVRGSSFVNKKDEKKYILFIRDISRRKQAEETFSAFMDSAPIGFSIWDSELNFIDNNEAAMKLLPPGTSKEQLFGKNIFDFISEERKKRVYGEYMDVLKTGNTLIKDDVIYHPKYGKMHLALRAFKVGEGLGLIMTDITEKAEADQKLKESEQKYRVAYEQAEFYKDLFTHDINNILQTILSTTELGTLSLDESSRITDFNAILDDIKKQVQRGASLVSNVLILSKLEKMDLDLKETDVLEIVKNAIDLVSNGNHKQIQVDTDAPENNFYVMANELLLDAFENIIINAIKHNNSPVKELLIKISKEMNDDQRCIKLEFIDNGYGIEDVRKKSIFERGYKSDKSVSGMGLGLSLVKTIINSFNGNIWVEDKIKGDYSQGSKFILLIPEVV